MGFFICLFVLLSLTIARIATFKLQAIYIDNYSCIFGPSDFFPVTLPLRTLKVPFFLLLCVSISSFL